VATIPATFAQADLAFDLPGQAVDDAHVVFGILAAAYDSALADVIFSEWETNVLPLQSNAITLNSVTLRDSDANVFVSSQSPAQGGASSEMEQPQVAVLVKKLSTIGGRANKGRMYIPGVPGAALVPEGVMASGVQATWQNGFDNFFASLGATDVGMFILHSGVAFPTSVSSLQVSPVVATQRRRGPRG